MIDMKTKFMSVFAILTVPFLSFSQISIERDVIATAGETSNTPSLNVSWTIGEMAINESVNANFIITEGFQQGEQDFTGINEEFLGTEINVFPNPVTDILNYTITSEQSVELNIQLFDESGRLVEEFTPIKANAMIEGKIDMSQYASGKWILRFQSESQGLLKTFSILKLN